MGVKGFGCGFRRAGGTGARTAGGFSIVELLVVVAILAVLLSIVVPSVSQAKRWARVAVCHANLAHLNRALELYAADHRQKYWMFTHATGHYWIDKIDDYHDGQTDLWRCPEALTATPLLGSWGTADEAWGPYRGRYGSYGLNLWLTPNDPGTMAEISPYYNQFLPYEHYFWRSPAMTSPGPVPTFCDSSWVGSWPFTNDLVPDDLFLGLRSHTAREGGEFMGRFCIDRHMFSVCSGFADGSARQVRLPELWELQWSRHYEPVEVDIPEP